MTEKKGRKSWTPASRLTVVRPPEGHTLRWVSKEGGNYQKRRADGWVPVNSTTATQVKHEHPDLTGDGKPMTSAIEYRDMVLCALPTEDYEAHREYYRKQAEDAKAGLKRNAIKANADNANGGQPAHIYGKIVIE